MSELDDVFRREAEHAEQSKDAPAGPTTKVTRGHDRVRVLQVRLNEDELTAVKSIAETAGLPVSTLVRSWILDRVQNLDSACQCAGAGEGN
jgi:predicted DNA binding CopG/RHH family protein